MKKEIIETIQFNTKSPEGLIAAIENLKGSKADYVRVSPEFLIELFEEVLGFRSEEKFVKPAKRPVVLTGAITKIWTVCGDMYITINKDKNGNLFEVLISLGKAGGCTAGQTDAVGTLITLALQSKTDPEKIIKRLRGISCAGSNNKDTHSCSNAIALAMSQAMNQTKNKISLLKQNDKKAYFLSLQDMK